MATEKRLIDANALLDLFTARRTTLTPIKMRVLLAEAPTVDAVEVVRCKDCAQWGGVAFGSVCRRWSAPLAGMKNCTGPDDYCSYGERKYDDGKVD